jgi:hypothetical protein
MPFFPNTQLELWEYQESTTEFNLYGEPELEYNHVTTVDCDMQPLSVSDSLKEYGKILQDTYKTYLDINAPITDTMICRVQNQPDTYKVIGTPSHNNHLLHHIKLLLQKERKPTPLP